MTPEMAAVVSVQVGWQAQRHPLAAWHTWQSMGHDNYHIIEEGGGGGGIGGEGGGVSGGVEEEKEEEEGGDIGGPRKLLY